MPAQHINEWGRVALSDDTIANLLAAIRQGVENLR
jgi:hypothetical protein